MTVKEVIALAAGCLGREELVSALDKEEVSEEEKLEFDAFLRAYNFVENEVALDYFPLKKEELFAPVEHKVSYTRFSSAPVDVLKVTDGNGRTVEFEIRPTHIYLPEEQGVVSVTYSYAPVQKSIEDSSEFSGKISARLLAYGVASEFSLVCARYQEAAMWEKRFRDALKCANLCRRKLSMSSRRWV